MARATWCGPSPADGGRGQRGHRWHSAGGENVTFTLVLEPRFLPVDRQFLLSEAVTLGIVDCLAENGIAASIKWTNDIYVGDRKITGMLIEHKLGDGVINRTLAGIGVNVNQTEFDPSLPNPVSMALAAGRQFDRRPLLERLVACIMARYGAVRAGARPSRRCSATITAISTASARSTGTGGPTAAASAARYAAWSLRVRYSWRMPRRARCAGISSAR